MKKVILLLFLVGVASACDEDEFTPTAIKLDYYEETYDMDGLGFEPKNKTVYEYNSDGKLARYTFFGYDPTPDAMVEQRHFEFNYLDGRLDNIEGFLVNTTTPYVIYRYLYDANFVLTKITEDNYSAGISSEGTFSYPSANIIQVAYKFSNGGSFEYEVTLEDDNILSDKTTRGSQLCSDGEYTYDQHPNPFKTLEYIDYFLVNISDNNKLTEDVNYVGCAFPTLRPESYDYTYNSDGYPTEVVTNYQPHDDFTPKSIRKYYYKAI
jgi:hypothetical protein